MPRARAYEPSALTAKEKRDKAHAKAQACKKGLSLTKFCKKSGSRYCRLVRCIRKVEKRCRTEPKQCPRSPVAVCRVSIYGK